jgi:glutathione S-transferase
LGAGPFALDEANAARVRGAHLRGRTIMKLYYAPGACSLAPHIVAREAGLRLDLEKVDLKSHTTETGANFRDINPKGYVPALKLDDGALLTENAAILQYLGDQAPEAGLLPPAGDFERYRVVEWLTFISTELHKGFGPLFNPQLPAAAREQTIAKLNDRFAYLQGRLDGREFAHGPRFTVADAYLFTVLGWTQAHNIDLSPYPALKAYRERLSARAGVRQALQEEGLLEAAG